MQSKKVSQNGKGKTPRSAVVFAGLVVLAATLILSQMGGPQIRQISKSAQGNVVESITKSPGSVSEQEAHSNAMLAEANGMRLLAKDEIAVVRKGYSPNPQEKKAKKDDKKTKKSGSSGTQRIVMVDGLSFPVQFDTDAVQDIHVIKGDGITTFVNSGPEVEIHTLDELESMSTDKVDPGVSRKIKENGVASAIVQFDLPKPFYEKGQDAVKGAGKKAKLNEAKAHAATKLKGKGKIKQDLDIINGVTMDLDQASLDALSHDSSVKKIELDRTIHMTLDTSVGQIKADQVWPLLSPTNLPLTGFGERIAVIDTGVDYTHPDLGGCFGPNCKVIGGWDFVNNDADPMDDQGHGTHVSATAAGNGLLKGVAPDAKIVAYKVLDSAGSGPSSGIIAAINRAADPNLDGNTSDHVDVLTMSLGGSGNPDDGMSLAVDQATAAGVVSTIAAANSGPTPSTIQSPGTSRTAITVAAACKPSQIGSDSRCLSGPIASFSSRGPLIWDGIDIKKPDISAPGVLICAARWATSFSSAPTCFDTAHIRISGTSMATPHMAGVAALVREAYPSYTPDQVKQLLKSTATDLGVSYDLQGAGLVDTKAAIPLSPQLTVSPASWNVTTDATTRNTTQKQVFSVTPIDASINSLAVSFSFTVPGVTFTSSKSVLQVGNKSTDSFEATAVIDNDQAKNGNYFGTVVLAENGNTKGIIPIYLTITPTMTANLTSLDYGVDNPSLLSWTSSVQSVVLHNERSDVSQTVTITPPTYPAGVSFSGPATVTVPAGGSTSVDTSLTITNSQVANGMYSGSLTFSNSANTVLIGTKFIKYFQLILQDPDTAKLQFATTIVHNQIQAFYGTSGSKPMYLNSPGSYDIIVNYGPKFDATHAYGIKVIKEGVQVNQGTTTVPVSRNDATNLVQTIATDSTGNTIDKLLLREMVYSYYLFGNSEAVASNYFDLSSDYISTVSSNYNFKEYFFAPDFQPADVVHFFYNEFSGLQGPRTVTNTPADFSVTRVQNDINRAGAITPFVNICTDGCGFGGIDPSVSLLAPGTQMIYSLLPPSTHAFLQQSDWNKNGCSSFTGACPYTFYSPVFSSNQQRWASSYGKTILLPPMVSDTQYNGLGPNVWFTKFQNNPTTISFLPYFYGSNAKYAAFLRQDYSLLQYDAIPYTVYKDGTLVASGSLPPFMPSSPGYSGSYLGNLNVATSGRYEVRADVPYQINGLDMAGNVRANFDTSQSDPNPPAIRRLYMYSGDLRSETYDSTVTNKLEFELDPIGGSMSQVVMSYSTDGTNFTPVTVSTVGNVYTVTLPSITVPNLLSLKLDATDSSQNSLSYTFQIPTSQTSPLKPQTLTITKSGNGTGKVTSSPVGISCGSMCSARFSSGSTVTLVATPSTVGGSSFTGWSGACSGNGSCTVTMDSAKSVTAQFTVTSPVQTLTISKSGTGANFAIVTSSPASINCGSTCSANFVQGTTVTLSDSLFDATFVGWSGACTGTNDCIVTMDAAKSVDAQFVSLSSGAQTLQMQKSGAVMGGTVKSTPVGIDCGPGCTFARNQFADGSTVTLTATAAPSYEFKGWGGVCSGTSATCAVTMDSYKLVYANFDVVVGQQTLTVSKSLSGTADGTVTSTPAGINCGSTCSAAFTTGSSVTLTAVPSAGSQFTNWSGACSGSSATCTVAMVVVQSVTAQFDTVTSNQTLSVAKSGIGTGTVTSSPAGINCGATCSASFAAGDSVALSATPASGSTFAGWSGSCAGTGSCTLTMDATKNVTAQFNTTGTGYMLLSISKSGNTTEGTLTSSPAGIDCGATCNNQSAQFASGTTVTITATTTSGYMLSMWDGACWGTASTCTVTMDAAKSVSARFDSVSSPYQILTVSKVGTGNGTVTSNPSGINCGTSCSGQSFQVTAGTSVTLTASPAAGSTFAGWGGACTGIGTCTVSMNSTQSVTAQFTVTASNQTLTVSKSGTGTGTVTSSPAGINCGATCAATFTTGTSVSLTATPAPGSTFAGWTGACTGTGSCTVSMSAAQSVTASFNASSSTTQTLTVSKTGTGVGTVTSNPAGINCGATCSANFANGSNVTLTATPASGSAFAGWIGACTGTSTCTVKMDSAKNVTAQFTYTSLTVVVTSPADGTVFTNKSNVQIVAVANSSAGIKTITLLMDNAIVKTCNSTPCSFGIDERKAKTGAHTIMANAIDKVGNTANSAVVTVTKL